MCLPIFLTINFQVKINMREASLNDFDFDLLVKKIIIFKKLVLKNIVVQASFRELFELQLSNF